MDIATYVSLGASDGVCRYDMQVLPRQRGQTTGTRELGNCGLGLDVIHGCAPAVQSYDRRSRLSSLNGSIFTIPKSLAQSFGRTQSRKTSFCQQKTTSSCAEPKQKKTPKPRAHPSPPAGHTRATCRFLTGRFQSHVPHTFRAARRRGGT